MKNKEENVSMEQLQKNYEYIQSLKNYDYVNYHGGEPWKPHRNFKEFKLTNKDLKITRKQFKDLKEMLESVWYFCDSIFLEDRAEEDDLHVFDYCFHGERMGWKEGDEYWLVFNRAVRRFEIRKADVNKWTPLDKFFINEDLELRFKLGYIIDNNDKYRFRHEDYKDVKYKFIQNFCVNSFPDRIELSFFTGADDKDEECTSCYQILYYYMHFSPLYKDGFNKELFDDENNESISDLIILNELRKSCSCFDSRYYNLYKEDEHEDMQKVYEDVLKYSHQLKFYQAHQKRKKHL